MTKIDLSAVDNYWLRFRAIFLSGQTDKEIKKEREEAVKERAGEFFFEILGDFVEGLKKYPSEHKPKGDANWKPIGATVNWGGTVCLAFQDGKVNFCSRADKILYPEYWTKDPAWPHDPVTGEKLPIYQP